MDQPTKRLFVALPLDEAMRAALHDAAAAADLPAMRPTPPANLHLTLKFLGDTPAETIADLGRTLREWLDQSRAFDLRCTGQWLLFPGPRRPRVLAAEIEPNPALLDLADRVESACRSLGFDAEPRPLRPHVTVGRFKFKGRPPRLDADHAQALNAAPALTSHADRALLFSSELTREGPIHTVAETIPLADPTDAAASASSPPPSAL